MSRRRHTPEQIITALREAEVGLANGKTVAMVSRELGVSEQTYYRWRQEFGARWHGCVWSDQTILSKPPRQADDQDVSYKARKLTGDAPISNWTWHGAVPRTWKPAYADRETTREVVLHIHNPIGGEKIYRATDTYPVGSYDGKIETTVLCTGDRFIVY